MKVGATLRSYRLRNGKTQADLAADSVVNDKYYGRLERDECSPTVDKLQAICDALGVNLSDFFRTCESND